MKRSGSWEWLLIATSAMAFILGIYVAPYYETIFSVMEPEDSPKPIALTFEIIGFLLMGGLIARIIYRVRKKSRDDD